MADLDHHQSMQEEQGIEEFPLYDAVKDKPLHIYKVVPADPLSCSWLWQLLTKCNGLQVVINGLQRTKLYLVSRELQQLTDEEHTLDEIKDDLLRCQEALEGLGVFKGVELVLDSGHPVSHVASRHSKSGLVSRACTAPSRDWGHLVQDIAAGTLKDVLCQENAQIAAATCQY